MDSSVVRHEENRPHVDLTVRGRSSSAAEYRAGPGARVTILPGVGHSPMLEDPPLTAELLLAVTRMHALS
jgi:pimeloyl-ACP methyl ester carboxylesterase